MDNFTTALGLTLFAGMATGIGSILAFVAPRTNYRFLSFGTGFSAGVMLYVSFVEIFSIKGSSALIEAFGDKLGSWINVASFFAGIGIIGFIDALIPQEENPHTVHSEEKYSKLHDNNRSSELTNGNSKKLMRMGLFTALAIAIHNFPEGLATFIAALEDPMIGTALAIAIALHNIPEGISVSIPIYYATGNRKKAFIYSFLSGLAEPIGALLGYWLITIFIGSGGDIPAHIEGMLFSGVAGVMVYISLDELLPTSRAYCKGHDSIIGLVMGMGVMAFSLLLFK